jgi:LmbE family N-acetylglucosaminyl deacetylase
MRWIYISPHLDDAVLSCGGLIYEQTRQGIPVEIWTINSGIPDRTQPLSDFAKRTHKRWGTRTGRGTLILRRREDKAAAAAVGASTRYFKHVDCIYRWGKDGQPLYPIDVFDPPHAEDAEIPGRIAASLKFLLHKDDVVVSPLSVGHHVDHVLTRLGVERLGRALLYYVDIPYILKTPEELAPQVEGMESVLHPVSEKGSMAWQAGIAAYASQIEMLFTVGENLSPVMTEYWSREKGIRLWKPVHLD